jgi:hypothetical protein
MTQESIDNLVKMLQASVAPCLLISGFGFLILTMTNRLARATDRIRRLHEKLDEVDETMGQSIIRQVTIFFKRCRILQAAIACLTFSIFFVGINVLLLFTSLRFELDLRRSVEVFFALSILTLIASLSLFLADISITLKSIRIEIEADRRFKSVRL